jgi:DNA-binding SARP family transcriptional activator
VTVVLLPRGCPGTDARATFPGEMRSGHAPQRATICLSRCGEGGSRDAVPMVAERRAADGWKDVALRFALLGPVQVHGDDGPVEIRGALRRTLLAALLLHRGSVLSADRLGELIWGGRPPASVTTSLYNQIMRLRQALGDDGGLIRAVSPGYLIHIAPNDLDLTEFADLCAQARRAAAASDWPSCSRLYTAALALWRGEMLADVPSLHDHPSIHQFTEDRLMALEGRVEADLHLGRHDELIGELRTLTVSHPLRETFHAQLMLALYRAGRQADALNVYRDLRRATRGELGVEPGAAVRKLQQRILSSDPTLSPPRPNTDAAALSPSPAPRAVPEQLPAAVATPADRPADLDELVSLVEATVHGADTGMVVISSNNGVGGVGKTALAVNAAHRLRSRYPDGQLFIELRGSATAEPSTTGAASPSMRPPADPSTSAADLSPDLSLTSECPPPPEPPVAPMPPMPPEDALDHLLRSLDVPPHAIPADLDERAALYRSRLAGTRTLILLDDAANTAQVQPLLPGTPGCLVLITSRNRMMGLDDAHFFALGAAEA